MNYVFCWKYLPLFPGKGAWLWRSCFADRISSLQFLSGPPTHSPVSFKIFFHSLFFLNWGCSNLTHLPRRPKKLNIMIKVGSVLTPCMIGFRLRESIWAYMIYALNVILWRFCIMLLFFSESFMFIVSLHQLLLYSVYGREIWPIGYCGCFVLAGIYELPPIKEMHQISH